MRNASPPRAGGVRNNLNFLSKMALFIIGLVILVAGYFTYGKFIERLIAPDDRQTPAVKDYDGVDFLVLPHWKNMLIQLLNIAGVGPVIGVIIGVKFGAMVFLIIPIGNIIAGATHDFLGGMMSMRSRGANLPAIVKSNLGSWYSSIFFVFMCLLLFLVVAVFINVPADLINSLVPKTDIFWLAVAAIFVYYIAATLFPIDKIIGKIYPIFGGLLLIGTLAIFAALMWESFENPALLSESEAFSAKMWRAENGHPVIPLLFVTIACGIISGFHATQSPIVARTMKSERQARQTFYGMMVAEGFIAMVWAAGALAIYNLFPEEFSNRAPLVLSKITTYFLGSWMGAVTVIGVVILAITSGDTAMRSLRLSIAEMSGMRQKKISARICIVVPLILVIAGLLAWSNSSEESFNQLWNYFAWGNQVLAASTLIAAAVWLRKAGKTCLPALIPGMFMAFIVFSYILWVSPEHGGPVGFGMSLKSSYVLAAFATLFAAFFALRGVGLRARRPRKSSDAQIK